MREKPKKETPEQKDVHFKMELEKYLRFEKVVYAMGYSVSEYLRMKAMEVLER